MTEDDTEEVIVSWWQKWKQRFEIVMATKKLAMFLWSLIFGVTGTMAVGQITETNPLRDGAIGVGLVEQDVPRETLPITEPVVIEHEHGLEKHTHSLVPHSHDLLAHQHELPAHDHDFTVTAQDLEGLLPADHMELH